MTTIDTPTTSEDEGRAWQKRWDITFGIVAIVIGLGCVAVGFARPVACAPIWGYGAAIVTLGVMLVQAGRR